MSRVILVLMASSLVAPAARVSSYSSDIVMLNGGRVLQTLRLYASSTGSRVEDFTAGPLGRVVTIARKDRGVVWTLYPDKRQYSERPFNAGPAQPADLANLDLASMRTETLGRETVLGYACTKLRVSVGNMPNGRPLVSTVWVADSLQLPVRMEVMGMVQENRNLRPGPQAASLFEIPPGYVKTGAPGMLPGVPSGLERSMPAMTRSGGMAAAAPMSAAAAVSQAPRWRDNTNYPGGDYRSIDMRTSDPTACKAACDRDAPCKAWTLVKPEAPGGMGYCWLKDVVPPATAESCCVSGLKGAAGGGSVVRRQYEDNTNRQGEDYRDFLPSRAEPAACAEACEREARCRAWTWVKAELEGPNGHCWLKTPAPPAEQDECCISGLKGATGGGTVTRRQYEDNTNRQGEDYRDFLPARADPSACAEACAREGRCRAWTWVKAELEGPNGHCWLKSPAPPTTQDDCCVSGLKR